MLIPGPKTLFLDTETFCELSLKTHGAYRYAEDAEVIMTQTAWGEDPVDVVEGLPENLQEMIDYADEIVIQNSFFDRMVLKFQGVTIPVEKITDTMVLALAHGYPGGLEQMCDALRIPMELAKKKDGKKWINLFCKPRPKKQKLRRATKESHPEEWAQFLDYGGHDILSIREAWKILPRWNVQPFERKLWYLDQKINERGILIDLDLANAALRASDKAKHELAEEAADATDNAIKSTTQRDRFKAFLTDDMDFHLPDLKKGTIKAALKRKDLTPEVRELLENRQQASLTSPSKYKTLLRAVSPHDQRLRGTLQFCGAARTSRWGGRMFQPQNLPRPLHSWPMIELGIAAMKEDCADLIFEKVMELCSSGVRSCLIAPPGRKLRISDLSNIEGRVSAWLAGETWKVKAFSDLDKGVGVDLYVLAYARTFGVDPQVVIDNKKHGDGMMRQIGKVCVGAETLVLTKRGAIAILDVRPDDQVWDGVEWVKHGGLLQQGRKNTISLAGVRITPDHMVLTQNSWTPAHEVASNEKHLYRALESGSENLPWSGSITSRQGVSTVSLLGVLAAQTPTWFGNTILRKARALGALLVPKNKAGIGARSFGGTQTLCRTSATAEGFSTAYPPACKGATIQKQNSTRIMAAGAYKCMRRGAKTVARFSSIWSRLKVGTNLFLNWTGKTPIKAMSPEIFASSRAPSTRLIKDASAFSKNGSMSLRDVYDLADAGPRKRFTILTDAGPIIVHNCELALGYGGAVGAFASMALLYGVELPEDEIVEIVQKWRRAHPAIKKYWYDLEWIIRQAFRNPGNSFKAGPITADRVGHTVRLKMPGGSYLCYPHFNEDDDGQCSYEGLNQYTRKWERIRSYGPKFFENVVQKIARDILARGMVKSEMMGHELVLHVHDELISETDDDSENNDTQLSAILATNPPWALDLPLAAAGFSTQIYHKD